RRRRALCHAARRADRDRARRMRLAWPAALALLACVAAQAVAQNAATPPAPPTAPPSAPSDTAPPAPPPAAATPATKPPPANLTTLAAADARSILGKKV